MQTYLLGIDIGTSSCKTGVFDAEGKLIAAADAAYSVQYPQPGWAQQRPEDWWQAVIDCLKRLFSSGTVKAADIAGIGVDGQSWAMVPMDKQGEALMPSPIWTDCRSKQECEEMVECIGHEALFSCSGNPVMPGYTLPKALWYKHHEPDLYRQTEKILGSNGYIVYRLTGAWTLDLSQGYGWHCFDMAHGTWNKALAEALGISSALLPELYPCSQVVGRVTPQAAAVTGLLAGTPVVAGGLDAACSAFGVGVIQSGETQEQGGQAGGMSICMDACRAHSSLILSRHVVPGHWLLQGGTTGGGGALKWFREQFCPELTFQQMTDAALQVRPGSNGLIFLPYMSGERSPLWNPDAKGVFFGLSFHTTRPQMIRAVMEGVAFSLRHNLETAQSAGAVIRIMRSTGGSTHSEAWMQIKADVANCVLEVPQTEAAAVRGAAILAGIGTGVIKDWKKTAKSIPMNRPYRPDTENASLYDKQYRKYLQLVSALEPIMKKETTC